MMQFEDQEISVETTFGPTRVRIAGSALHVLWGDGVGPQDAAGLLAANQELISHLATIKREGDEVDEDGVVEISALEIEN
jgi:hypothetical protein